MTINSKKINLNIIVWTASLCMLFLPNLIAPQYVIAKTHLKNKCRIVCKHRNKHGVCLVRGQDCGVKKVKPTKLYAIFPDKNKDKNKDQSNEKNKGKLTCHHSDPPHPSYTKNHRHMDEDCCMDPDEWENPKCAY